MNTKRSFLAALASLFGMAVAAPAVACELRDTQNAKGRAVSWQRDALHGEDGADLSAIKARSVDPVLRERLALIRYGVPFDVAFSLPNDERCAWLVAFGELDGATFDWVSGRWWTNAHRAETVNLHATRIAASSRPFSSAVPPSFPKGY
jgi:hypothetical protein